MAKYLILVFVLFIGACSTSRPTPYQQGKKDKSGYSDRTFEGMKVATFRGNSHTSKDRAQKCAEFRAIEQCRANENKHANIIDIFDKTIQKEVTRSTGNTWGPSYFGMYPYYSRYSSFGVGAGFNTISTNSWNETLLFPVIEVLYTCEDKIYRPQIIFRELPAAEIKHLVKDVKGAIQIEKIQEESSNKNSMALGDILLRADGKRIERVYELIHLFNSSKQRVQVDYLREGEKKQWYLTSQDMTSEVKKAEEKIIKKVCGYKEKKEQEELKKSTLCKNH